ncbi:hypothetical protein SAMN03080594_102618 [Arenibacter palladensis]|uniref:Two component regulator propeller n=1 Tax=Arenibacter palladensis TaxID=237373 RepID=A0A1M4YYI5_9FLAO|nr:hypothetical protein [Arenibacter palladensis]SHF10552.1 hypothetical protein SAMN03080594_102618 [Arenibacter palladensis]
MKKLFLGFCLLVGLATKAQTYVDQPFLQDSAEKFSLEEGEGNAALLQIASDRNKVIKVLSSLGLMLPHEKSIRQDVQYRPLIDMNILAMTEYQGQFVYLTDKAVLSNAWAGKLYIKHNLKAPMAMGMGPDFLTLIAGEGDFVVFKNDLEVWRSSIDNPKPISVQYDSNSGQFLLLTADGLYQIDSSSKSSKKVFNGTNLTAFTFHDDSIVLGTSNGIQILDRKTFVPNKLDQKLPWTEITTVKNIRGSLWFGSAKGAFKLREDGKYDYYASKRWLVDDQVVDLAEGPDGIVLVLTQKGMSKINFAPMTLAQKAEYFQEIQRLRHIRYGFTTDLSMRTPGDLSTGYFHDTDNDGLWTSMYLAGELFRYAVTKSEDAKQNAYEAFEAMERLTALPDLKGFPARSFERDGYEVGLHANGFSEEWRQQWEKENGRIWQLSDDELWRWKSTTSSDESCGHFFVYALFAELAPDKEWRDRAIHQIKIEMDHIMDNDWYLMDWNGKPTAWGKWNPEYVNSFPINVGDRRLNSTLILSFLQTAYHFTQDKKYKKGAEKLIKKYGYDENANRPATVIGFVEGEDLSNKWNHSDDEMYFLTIPGFVNYSFSDEQKEAHFNAVKSHWEVERSEKNPLWNYLFALTGGKNIDSEESAWWLREFPMDLIDWKIDNDHRKDLTKIAPNFRSQTYTEVLPGDERTLHLHNGAYRNNGGSDGKREYAPYIYLLPYWAGRYVDAISAPQAE